MKGAKTCDALEVLGVMRLLGLGHLVSKTVGERCAHQWVRVVAGWLGVGVLEWDV